VVVVASAALLLPLVLALRLPASLDGQDGVNFALALADYDVGLEQPHFPGYPVYIALARALGALGLREELALALPGIALAPALVVAVFTLARAAGVASGVASAAALLVALHPLVWSEGARPRPDLLGTCGAWICLALAARARAHASGGALGLALGVRLDLAAVAGLLVALPAGARRRALAGLALGIAIWLPLFALAVAPTFPLDAAEFLRGHFADFGSSLLGASGRAPSRARAAGEALLALGPGVAALAAAAIGFGRMPAALSRLLLCALAPYALWVACGQNLSNARHWLPLVPVAALGVACALASLPAWRREVAAFALLLAALPTLGRLATPALDGRALVQAVVEACDGCDAVYVGASARLFERYAPAGFPAQRRRDLRAVELELAAFGAGRHGLLATDEVEGIAARAHLLAELPGGLRLYRLDAEALR
jgi:hypothetical protein